MSQPTAAADRPTLPPAESLPDDPATLKRMILELLATLHEERRDKEALRYRLDQLLRRLYGPRGERFHPQQPLLFGDLSAAGEEAPAVPPAEPESSSKEKRRGRPHGRRRMPANLPRETRHYELAEAERCCSGCGQQCQDIGVDRSEQLDYRPASLFVIEHLIHKYVCPHCRPAAPTTPPDASVPEVGVTPVLNDLAAVVITAPRPAAPIAKGLPGPGLLAHLIVSKWVDHLPCYRLERVYERQGLVLNRSTLCDWLAACAKLLRPLYELMVARVLLSRVIHTDDTPVDMQLATHRLQQANLWGYLGDAAHPYNVFDFTTSRKRDGPRRFLTGYQGYLQADAFSGYDGLYLPDPVDGVARIIEVACNAHARRKFYEARTSDALRAHQALAYYGQLYEIERRASANHSDDDQRRQMRQDLALPIWKQFQTWLENQPDVLPKSPMGQALQYARNQWTALVRYTEAGFLAIDNNVTEREMKRIALGRKNWLFVGSEQGGHTAAVLLSFTSTCRRLPIEPWAYLRDVLTRLPTTPPPSLEELLPDRWAAARLASPGTPAEPARGPALPTSSLEPPI